MAHICMDHLPTRAPILPSCWLLLLNSYLTANPAEITGTQASLHIFNKGRGGWEHRAAIKSVWKIKPDQYAGGGPEMAELDLGGHLCSSRTFNFAVGFLMNPCEFRNQILPFQGFFLFFMLRNLKKKNQEPYYDGARVMFSFPWVCTLTYIYVIGSSVISHHLNAAFLTKVHCAAVLPVH